MFAFDNDSKLNSDEGKEKLREVGLSDELYVGHWIAAKLENQYESQDLSQNLLKYLQKKKSSTLKSYSCKVILNVIWNLFLRVTHRSCTYI